MSLEFDEMDENPVYLPEEEDILSHWPYFNQYGGEGYE